MDIGEWRRPSVDGAMAHVLDQLAIVTQCDVQVYHPRRNVDGLSPDMKKWLDQSPGW